MDELDAIDQLRNREDVQYREETVNLDAEEFVNEDRLRRYF